MTERPRPAAEKAECTSSIFSRIIFSLIRLFGAISTMLVLVLLAIVSYSIVQRYILDQPLQWGDELTGYVLVAFVMFGAAEALRRGDHITIDLIQVLVPRAGGVYLDIWSNLAVLILAVVLGTGAWDAIKFAFDFGEYSSGYIEIQTWIPQLPMLLGSVLLGLAAFARIVDSLIMRNHR